VSKNSNEGAGCNCLLKESCGDHILYHVLGWVDCVCRTRTGKEKHKYMYPSAVTMEYMKTLVRVIVPCPHLQLYFQIMMGRTLLPRETVRFGFVNFSRKITHYFVDRVETRTDSPLPTWDLEDIPSLLPFWDKEIVVTYYTRDGEYRRPKVRYDTMGDVGVKETTMVVTSIKDGFTPAMFLGCSYLEICEFSDSAEFVCRLRVALLRRMPNHVDVRVKVASCDGHRYHVLQQWSLLQNNESGEDKSDEEMDSDSSW
jgi:hypothetical protein